MNTFSVLKVMLDQKLNVSIAPLSNLIGARYSVRKKMTVIKIETAGNVVGPILCGQMIGGFILADREQFERVKGELEVNLAEPPANQCTCSACGCRLAIGRNDGFLCGGCAEDCQQTAEWWQTNRPSAKPEPEAAVDPTLREPLKSLNSGVPDDQRVVSWEDANARIEALNKEIDRLQAQIISDKKSIPIDWYQRIRMAVFEPKYLVAHQQINRADLDLLLDTILGEPARTRAAVVAELRRYQERFRTASKGYLPNTVGRDVFESASEQLGLRANYLEREGAKEGGDASG